MTGRAAVTSAPLAISACGVLSAAGAGLASLGAALSEPVAAAGPAGPAEEYPTLPVRTVPEFSAADYLGRKGLRNLDRLTTLGMSACKLALDDASSWLAPDELSATGIVMGTSTGSIQTCAELSYDSATQERPYLINPAHFPNAVMNACAAQIAIRNSMHGPNVTISGGTLSGLLALRYARTAIGLGTASRLLVGAVEDMSPLLAWGWQVTGALGQHAAAGEGCAVFLVEKPDVRAAGAPAALAELLAVQVRYCGPVRTALMTGLTDGLAACISGTLERAGVSPADVTAVCTGATGSAALARAEERAIDRVLGRGPAGPELVRAGGVTGDCYSAAGALQLAVLLARWASGSSAPGVGLVTAVGWDGNVGCLAVRGLPPADDPLSAS